jgi:hypothetical protein
MAQKSKIDQFYKGSKTVVLESGNLPDTPLEVIDLYLKELKDKQQEWAQSYPIQKRIQLLEQTLQNVEKNKEKWIQLDLLARHIPENHWDMGTSYAVGPCFVGYLLRNYMEILKAMEKHGVNKLSGKVRQDGNRVIVDAFPLNIKDNFILPNMKAEIHLAQGSTVEALPSSQAKAYKDKSHPGGISLVLGAGNAAMLAVGDILHKLIVEKKVVILKTHPVLEYLGPLLQDVFSPFIKAGFLRIVSGGAQEGQHLVVHPLVDDIHMTGSDKTFEAIVYGRGEEGANNKKMKQPLNSKPVTAELGNVTPVIVVPGNWKESDFDYQAENILTMLAGLNGYACCAARVLILPKFWSGSEKLIAKLEEKMDKAKPAVNYYPGTAETVSDALSCYADCDQFGSLDQDHQPWLFAKNLDPNKEEVAFNREFWGTFMAQTYIEGVNRDDYLLNAVKFSNEKLWGTLSAVIIIDPKTEKEMRVSKTLQNAIDQLHYGTVSMNVSPGVGIFTMAPWGGYPGSTSDNIQSGNCFVFNRFMLDNIEKTVLHAPFRINPKPFFFVSDKPNQKAIQAWGDFLISNKSMDIARMLIAAMLF